MEAVVYVVVFENLRFKLFAANDRRVIRVSSQQVPTRSKRQSMAMPGSTPRWPLRRRNQERSVLTMVKRRAAAVGLPPEAVCNHSFRGTGLTNFMENGGSIDVAVGIAGHASTKTTQLYNRSVQAVEAEDVTSRRRRRRCCR